MPDFNRTITAECFETISSKTANGIRSRANPLREFNYEKWSVSREHFNETVTEGRPGGRLARSNPGALSRPAFSIGGIRVGATRYAGTRERDRVARVRTQPLWYAYVSRRSDRHEHTQQRFSAILHPCTRLYRASQKHVGGRLDDNGSPLERLETR